MNLNPIMNMDEQNVIEFSESPGRRLRVLRQSRGLEVERIAAQLHLRTDIIEALEQDRYQDLPGPVFVAGYLRNYARLLNIDPEPLLASHRAAHPEPDLDLEPDKGPLVSMRQPRPELASSHVLMRMISAAVALAVVTLVAIWWQNRAETLATSDPLSDSEPTTAIPDRTPITRKNTTPDTVSAEPMGAPSGTEVETKGTEPVQKPPSPTSGTRTPVESNPRSEPTRNGRESTPLDQADTSATAGTSMEDPAKEIEVTIAFNGPSWISVRDVNGKSVLSGEMRKGDTRSLNGTPPYSIVIGNSSAARILVAGKPVDLGKRSQGNVARFKLDPREFD